MGQRQRCITLACHVRKINNIKEKLMNKTKVVAMRLTEAEFQGLQLLRKQHGGHSVGYILRKQLDAFMVEAVNAYRKEQKRLEAKAKREAKKAENNGL
jgi:hypothetical protein